MACIDHTNAPGKIQQGIAIEIVYQRPFSRRDRHIGCPCGTSRQGSCASRQKSLTLGAGDRSVDTNGANDGQGFNGSRGHSDLELKNEN